MAIAIHWPRLLRRTLRIFTALVSLLFMGWLGLAWYVNAHKREILASLSKQLSESLRGDLHIGSMEPSLFRSFPNISISLNDVSLHDSLWSQHRHSLLEARNLYIHVNPIALLSRRVEIGQIVAAHGSIFIFTDSAGYSNTYLLGRRDTAKTNRPAIADYFGLEDMHFWFVNQAKQKLFHFYIKDLNGTSSRTAGVIRINASASTHIYGLAFSTIRGAYLKDQDLRFRIGMSYQISDKHLHIPDQDIRVGGRPIVFGGDFYFDQKPPAFAIHLGAKDIPYKTALSWMSDNIQHSLQPYDFMKPVTMDIQVSGVMQYHHVPLVKITYPISDNTLVTPVGSIDHLTYKGRYDNEVYPGRGHGDDNSLVAMYGLSGEWRGIPFKGDTLEVINLLKPVVKAHIKSSFPLTSLNDIIGGSIMSFNHGSADADIRYEGAILTRDTTPHAINGYLRVSDAGLSYLPRNLAFTNVNATLLFQGDDLFFRNISLRSKQSSLVMEGDALHFLRLYFSDPGKVLINWRMQSPLINLNDFVGFAARRHSISKRPLLRSNAITRISYQLDRVLTEASFSLDARIKHILYKSFVADDVVAQLTLTQSGIFLKEVQIRNGGGSLSISGNVDQAAPNNPFHIRAQVRNANVTKLFASFDNFGQSAISSENLAGLVSSDADLTGNVTDAGSILKNSFNGTVSFRLDNGAINHFSAFEKIGKFIFKKRNLSAVSVKELQGQLEVRGTKILIHPMNIQTSALNMEVQGVYGLGGGTDIFIAVPLRNPEKEGAKTPIGMILRTGKGVVVHLRAQDPNGEGVKIGWDPLRHGRKATEEALTEQ